MCPEQMVELNGLVALPVVLTYMNVRNYMYVKNYFDLSFTLLHFSLFREESGLCNFLPFQSVG